MIWALHLSRTLISMEDTTWSQKLQALTFIITNPSTPPHPLYSQIFISTQIPCYINWDYPPILCNKPEPAGSFLPLHFRWAFSVYLKKLSRFGFPETSWRSKCPYQVPPPLILAKGVEEAKWGEDEKREYVRKRFRRKAGGIDVNPLIPILVPNVLLIVCFLILNPAHDD